MRGPNSRLLRCEAFKKAASFSINSDNVAKNLKSLRRTLRKVARRIVLEQLSWLRESAIAIMLQTPPVRP